MGTSEALALKKVLVKVFSERLEATHCMRSCGLSHNSTPSEFDGRKKLDVKYFKEKSSMLRSQKRGALDLMKYQIVKRQWIDRSLDLECFITLKQERIHLAGWDTHKCSVKHACLDAGWLKTQPVG